MITWCGFMAMWCGFTIMWCVSVIMWCGFEFTIMWCGFVIMWFCHYVMWWSRFVIMSFLRCVLWFLHYVIRFCHRLCLLVYPAAGYGFQNTRYPVVWSSPIIFPKFHVDFFKEDKKFVYKQQAIPKNCLGFETEAAGWAWAYWVRSQCLCRHISIIFVTQRQLSKNILGKHQWNCPGAFDAYSEIPSESR